MITPEYLEGTVERIASLYENVQESIIRDVTERLLYTDFDVADTAKWRIEKIQQSGMVYDKVLERISEATGKSQKELKKIFEDAGVEVFNYGDEVYQKLNMTPLDIRQSPAMLKVLKAGLQTTAGTMRNLVNTTALATENSFINACDAAHTMITSGAYSYNEAIAKAVGQAGKAGAFVYYPTGHRDRVDVAVRRAVLSGLGQTVGKLNEMVCDEMDCDLVEVTAHWNARPSHAEWQGLVYSRSGKNKDYPDFAVCGYGTGEGLLGWNCYHDYHPFFEGISERNYTDEELGRMKNNTVKYNGKTMTGYEATQVQRGIERSIRASKRQLIAYDTGMRFSSGELKDEFRFQYALESSRLSKLNAKLNDFCKQTGFQKQYDRARVQGFGRSQAQKAVQASKNLRKTVDNLRINGYNRFRKIKNVGSFKHLSEPMQKRHIMDIIKQMGIDYSNIEIDIIRDKELIGTGYMGYTFPTGEKVQLYPDAFLNREQLVKTIGHERIHCEQVKLFGKAETLEEELYYEKGPIFSEEYWWQEYVRRTGYGKYS